MTEISVMIIENDRTTGQALADHLRQKANISVVEFDNGDDALKDISLHPEKYTAILLDYGNPKIQGKEILNRIQGKYPHLPVIIFTDKDLMGDEEASIYRYIPRPVNQVEMLSLLKNLPQQDATFHQQQQLSALKQLSEIGSLLTLEITGNLRELLNRAANLACSLTGADCAVVYPYDPLKDQFYVTDGIGTYGLMDLGKKLEDRPRIGGLAALVHQAGIIIAHDIEKGDIKTGNTSDDDFLSGSDEALSKVKNANFVRREKVKAFVALSLMALEGDGDQRVSKKVGVLYIDYRELHHFTEEEVQIIQIFGHYVANAIHSTRLLNRERILREQAEMLRKASETISAELELEDVANKVLTELRNVTDYRKGSLQLIEGDKRRLIARRGFDPENEDNWLLRPISQDDLVKNIIDNKKPLILGSPKEHPDWDPTHAGDIESWIGLPLVYEGETVGLITLDHDQPKHFANVDEDMLVLFAGQISAAVKRASEVERRVRDLEIINDVVEAISSKLSTEDLLSTLASQMADKLNCTHCSVFFPERENGEVMLVQKVIFGPDSAKIKMRRFKSGEGIAGWIYENGKSLIVSDAATDKRFMPGVAAPKGTHRSMLAAPVKFNEQIIAVITADQDKFGWFDKNDQRLVDTLTQYLGVAIQRVTTLGILQRTSNQIIGAKSVRGILEDIVSGANELTQSMSGVIYLVNDDKQLVIDKYQYPPTFDNPTPRLDKKKGLTFEIVNSGKEIVIPDIRQDPRVNPILHGEIQSTVGVPLKFEDKVIGVLFQNSKKLNAFSETEVALLLTLAGQAAIAIQKTELNERSSLLQKLQEITTSITASSLDLENVLNQIVTSVSETFEGVYCAIRLYNAKAKEYGDRYAFGIVQELADRKPRKGGASDYVVRNKVPLYAGHLKDQVPESKGPIIRKELAQIGLQAAAYLPLETDGEAVGVIYIFWDKSQQFTAEERQILHLFADQAAIAIKNARLFEQLQSELGRSYQLSEQLQEELNRTKAISELGAELARLEQTI